LFTAGVGLYFGRTGLEYRSVYLEGGCLNVFVNLMSVV
jgi:hypothetical protein